MAAADRYLLAPISLGDIDDVEAFARSIIGRALPPGMYLRDDEREDEIGEVIEQLVDWYRPVAPPVCVACRRRRGEQHAWDCDALPPQRVRRCECLGCGVEPARVAGCNLNGEEWSRLDRSLAIHADGCPAADGRGEWGCVSCGRKRGDRHAGDCQHRHEQQQRYDPARTSSFILFARFKLTNYYVPDLCRRLLGRNGGRIAERSHSELDERAEPGHRPWEAFAPEQDGVRAGSGGDGERDQAERARAVARGRAVLGLRQAR